MTKITVLLDFATMYGVDEAFVDEEVTGFSSE